MKKDTSTTLIDAGLKVTPTRLAILEVFSGDCKPINAEYIFNTLRSEGLNLVTIYRTLATFVEKGILRFVNLNTDSAHYELSKHHHHHLICKDCGEIESVDVCNELLDKEAIAQSKKFKSVESHSVEFFGTCEKCSR
jgi:Fur family transcriptional regulator, peroxide stress response regulator